MMNEEWFTIFRNFAFLFATIMLVKYFVFLIIAPFYDVKEELRKMRINQKKSRKKSKEDPLISIIVPAWNEEVGIEKTVRSLVENTYKKSEIVVVNDGSTDDSDAVVLRLQESLKKEYGEAVNLKYFYKKNGGKGSALNHGIENSTGDIIVTMDADSVFDKNALENFIKYFEDERLDAVVGNVKVANQKTLIGLLQKLEYLFGFYYKRVHAVMNSEYIFGGACTAFRRSVFERIGLFDTKNKTEDIEMSMRSRFHGLKSTYGEDVVCWTEGASNVSGLVNQRLRWKKGRFDTFIKYRRMFFSLDKKHNFFLSWFVLPFSLIAEIQLFFEPIAISLLLTYSFISGDYLSLALGALFILVIYLVNALFTGEKSNLFLILLFPFTWPLFYVLVWIEFIALTESCRMVLRNSDVEWQKWDRKGVDNA